MEAGTVVKWLKSEGERVERGEPLYEIDTDKVTQEVESDFSGVLLKIALSSGEAPVGQTIAFIGEEGEDVPAGDGGAPESAEKPAEAPKRERARELNPDVRITLTDLLAKVCAQALMRHRGVNAEYTEDALRIHPNANVGIAVAAPQGLVVPVVRGVERLSLAETTAARGEVVGRARDNKLTSDDLSGGTFTISNLGMYGVEQFVAVLNPPQAAILAVGATLDTPVARDGQVVVRPTMTMTLTCDHRTIDGATAADFLRTVREFLEEPALTL